MHALTLSLFLIACGDAADLESVRHHDVGHDLGRVVEVVVAAEDHVGFSDEVETATVRVVGADDQVRVAVVVDVAGARGRVAELVQ